VIKQYIKFILLFFVLCTGCSADLHTKRLIKERLQQTSEITILKGYLEFKYTENKGMIFGLLDSKESAGTRILSVILNLITILLFMVIIWFCRTLSFFHLFPFFLILSGAFGNFINRILQGWVVDFIHIHFRDMVDWPYLFNLADVLICMGCVLLFLMIIFKADSFESEIHHLKSL